MADSRPILIIALGGNALIRKGQQGTIAEQMENLKRPLRQVARLSSRYRIVITHGNGPQVGNLMLQQECCPELPKLPLEILVAQTQGQIGYLIESVLDGELAAHGDAVPPPLVSLISYVVVDPADPAFSAPSKPVGPVFTAEQAAILPYPTAKTAKGYRRIVASPLPVTVVEKREIRTLLEQGFIVICCGGGGIPVVREGRGFHGVDAVIDKDLASARLGREVSADILVIATDVPGVFIDYGTGRQRMLNSLRGEAIDGYLQQGQFPEGSMGPKVRAAQNFLQGGGQRAVICALEAIEDALAGKAGTEVSL